MDFLNKFDKQQVQKITLIVIAALTVLALVLLLVIIIASINPANPFGLADGFSDLKEITVTEQDLQTGSLVLADEDHPYNPNEDWLDLLSSGGKVTSEGKTYGCGDYRDENLEKDENGNSLYKYYMNEKHQMQLTKECMYFAHKMFTDAEKEVALDQLFIKYCYGYVEDANDEYNTALLVTMAGYSDSYEVIDFPDQYRKWFDKHADEYGFIKSFEDSYRYVGVAHAKAISDSKDINSLADYIEYLKENTSVDKTIEIEVDGATYKSYYVSCQAGDTIKVPKGAEYTISGTNEGGVVVTVKVK